MYLVHRPNCCRLRCDHQHFVHTALEMENSVKIAASAPIRVNSMNHTDGNDSTSSNVRRAIPNE